MQTPLWPKEEKNYLAEIHGSTELPRSVKGRQDCINLTIETPHPQYTDNSMSPIPLKVSGTTHPTLPRGFCLCAPHSRTTLAEPLCLAAGSRHTAAEFLPPLTLSWNILHFFSPTLSKQVIFLLWKDAHCSCDIKDRSSVFSFKAAIGGVKLYYGD